MMTDQQSTPIASVRDKLAYDRTVLAVERTFLAYLRTAIALLAAGATLIILAADRPDFIMLAIALLAAGALILAFGLWRLRRFNQALKQLKQNNKLTRKIKT